MSTSPLQKSYVNNYNPDYPVQEDLVLYRLFQEARDEGHIGEMVNLETNERITTIELLDRVCINNT